MAAPMGANGPDPAHRLRGALGLEAPHSGAGAEEWAQGAAAEPYACRDARLHHLERGVAGMLGPSHHLTSPGDPVACAAPDWQRQYRPAIDGFAPSAPDGAVVPGAAVVTRSRATAMLVVGVVLLLLLAYAVGRHRTTPALAPHAPAPSSGGESGSGGSVFSPLDGEDSEDRWRPDSPPPLPMCTRAPLTDPLFQPLQAPPRG